jgi:DNA-binding MarR family transcriptional regulator
MLYVCVYYAAKQKAPTNRNICEHLRWLKSTNAGSVITPLVKKGYLEKDRGRRRSLGRNLVITDAGAEWFKSQPPQPPLVIQEHFELGT